MTPICPNCQSQTVVPFVMSANLRFRSVDYHECVACAHVWTTDKETQQFIAHVTTPTHQTLITNRK